MPITIKPTQLKYKDPSTSQYVSVVAAAEGGSSNVDVQINGTSIIDNGVANIPVADVDTLGTVKVRKADGYYGIKMLSNGTVTTSPATDAQVAIGTEAYRPLNPKRQHIATFFGLSKAAGVDLAQVSVNLGEYPASSKAAIKSMIGINVDDVQINGTSIVSNGVANIPIGNTTTPGVFIRGFGLYQDGAKLGVNGSTSENIKGGTAGTFTPVSKQHEATFYGLAKAAGDSTQSASSNVVGVYTDNAKTAIQNMLSVASSANPVFTGSISLGRKAETTVGEWSVAIGQAAEANYACTFAFGAQATASSYGAFATGVNAVASGYAAHAEGMYTIASGSYAHAEGVNTTASDQMAHAEGTGTNATGVASHAEGQSTLAFQFASHAQGMYTIASGPASHVFGRYNIADSYASWPEWVAGTSYSVNDKVKRTTVENEETTYLGYVCATANSDTTFNPVHWSPPVIMNYVEIVGNGESQSTRSNARALDWNGNQYLKGNLYVGCNADSTGGIRVPHDIQINGTSIVSNGIANIPQASNTNIGVIKTDPWFGTAIMSESGKIYINTASDSDIKTATQMYKPISPSSQHISVFYGLAKAAGDSTQSASSNAVGVYTNNAKAAIQNMLSIPSSNDPVFTGSFSQNRKVNTTVGPVSAVIGDDNSAEGVGAIAMGYNNRAYVQGSIALGTNNAIYGDGAVAIGYKNIAQYQSTFVFGQYNAIDTITDWASNVEYDVGDLVYNNAYVLKCLTAHTSGSTIDYSKWTMTINNLFTLGNGNSDNARSNALAVNFDGDLRIKGNLYVNCNADSSGGIRVPHDIQINGTSIVSNGIATVPIASDATFGVIKTREFTDGFKFDSNNNFQLAGPTDAQVKAGSTNFRAVTPYVQHTSVFYGLAKAAGDATQSASDNAVGTYTDGAKTAIKTMLDIPTLVSQLTNDSGFLTSVPTMTGATSSTAGASGLVPAPTSGDIYKFLAGDGTYRSGGLPMVILSYGNSTWSDFIEAYNNHVIVYCRASSNANPKTGSQTRMAFMAYVNNETTPTNVEFQYYRSMSSHSGTQMGDQVYVYKLDKNSGWSVTVREAGLKEIEIDASTGLKATWSNNKLTITTI